MKKTIQKLVVGLLLATGITTSVFAQWQNVGSAGFSTGAVAFTTLAFSPNGEPYLAFMDGGFSSKSSVKKFDGTSWIDIGNPGFSTGIAYNTSLIFSPSGEPYVAYIVSGYVSIDKFNGTSWENVGSGSQISSPQSVSPSIAFSPSGELYLAVTNLDNYQPIVLKFDGTTWQNTGTTGLSGVQAASINLAFSPSGESYVVYPNAMYSNKACVRKLNGTSWDAVGVATGISAGMAYPSSIVFSPNGDPYVAYRDGGNSNYATVMKFNGSTWQNVGTAGFSAGEAQYTSLAFSPSGEPYIAYQDGANSNKATVMKFDGTNWVNVGTIGFSVGEVQYTSLAISSSGEPYLAYTDVGNSNKATVMKFVDAVVPTAPDAPTALVATGSLNPVKVALNWADNATNEDGYKVERGTDGTNFTEIADLAVNSTSYNDLSVSEATTYHYRVYAYNTDGNSAFSNVEQVATGSTVGIDEINNTITAVYPNPANTVLNISVKENTSITIVNILGAIIATQNLQTGINSIDVSNLAKGVYLIQNANGGAVKFVKE